MWSLNVSKTFRSLWSREVLGKGDGGRGHGLALTGGVGPPPYPPRMGRSRLGSGLPGRTLGCRELGNRPTQQTAWGFSQECDGYEKESDGFNQPPVSQWDEAAGVVSGEADSSGHLSVFHCGSWVRGQGAVGTAAQCVGLHRLAQEGRFCQHFPLTPARSRCFWNRPGAQSIVLRPAAAGSLSGRQNPGGIG